MNRRDFIGGFGGLIAVSALPGCRTDGGSDELFAGRGKYERLQLSYGHIRAGATRPFSILHISDTHLAFAHEHEPVCRCGRAGLRMRTFGGRQEEALVSSLQWAKEHVDCLLHTGDLVDFQSEANFEAVRRCFGDAMPMFGSVGNHEFYSYLPDEVHTWQEPFKDGSWPILRDAFPFEARFSAQVVNGVNFVCLDDVFGTVCPDQVDRFRMEAKKGLPIVLCMHVPFFTEEIYRWTVRFWKASGEKYRSTALPEPAGDYKRQREDPTTRNFVSYLKGEKLLKGILAGHEHVSMEDRFSPTAMEYVVGGNFLFHGREVLFS